MAGGARFVPVPDLLEVIEGLPEVDAAVEATGQRIARGTVANSKMAQHYPARYGRVTVNRTGRLGRRRVVADGPLPHLDEWGSVNNPPRASMRRAAEREGRFVVEDRR